MDFFTCFTREKTPQNNFSSQNFSVENNYFFTKKKIYDALHLQTVTFYTDILTRKIKWIFSLMKKHHKTTFLIKISL